VNRRLDLSQVSGELVLAAAVLLVLALCALVGRIGADDEWLAALGREIADRGGVPAGVPFAAAASAHWPNPLVLAELCLAGCHAAFGVRGLMLAQLVAVAGGLGLLVRGARAEGADPVGTSAAVLLFMLGAISSLAIARVQLFSLVLFPALLLLLRADRRAPSRRLWLVVPLLALWSNLHGAVLAGLGVTLVYLALERGRRTPRLAAAVALASALAPCLTPAGVRTVVYLHGIVTGVAAERGVGEWGALSLHSPFDVLLVLAGGLLVWRALRARPAPWETVTIGLLALVTIRADRDGVWLLMVALAPAARCLRPERSLRALAPAVLPAAVVLLGLALVRGPVSAPGDGAAVAHAVALAHGSPVLAGSALDEQVALAGGRIWAGDPIDAFPRRVQAAYLDWLAGRPAGAAALAPGVRVVLVARGSTSAALMRRLGGFRRAWHDDGIVILQRRRPVL
jgi:hypothetical protein